MTSSATSPHVRTLPNEFDSPAYWETATDEDLLSSRLCDLSLTFEGSLVQRRLHRVHRELEAKNIVARPNAWFSEEFFNPDGILGFAIPFYLANSRLMRLERSQMLEVEGAGEAECRRIFRHEAGHAIDEAYQLHARQDYRKIFGNPSLPYPSSYKPKPNSRDFAINLSNWYAQAHPVEDFAETFSIWLNPHIEWRCDYADWPALRKLEFVDRLMQEIAGKQPAVINVTEVEPLSELRHTLAEHYAAKKRYFAWRWPQNYDVDLKRVFSDDTTNGPSATRFLLRVRAQLRTRIAEGTGVPAYAVDQLLRQMVARTRTLDLRVAETDAVTMEKLLVLLTLQTAGVVHKGYPKVAL